MTNLNATNGCRDSSLRLYCRLGASIPRASGKRRTLDEDADSVIVAACAALVLFSNNTSANHSWGGYHWARTANPFTIKAGDNVDSSWDAYLD